MKKVDTEAVMARAVAPGDDCVLWPGYADERNPPRISIGRNRWVVARFIWTVLNGPIPSGLDVLHSCGVLRCVRAAHLEIGKREHPQPRTAFPTLTELLDNTTPTESGCREWNGSLDNGYGRLCVENRRYTVTRLVWRALGKTLPDGYFMCHTCDNPPCINPEHLYAGTPADNSRDAVERGRLRPPVLPIRRGEENPNAKMADKTVVAILQYRSSGLTQMEIARRVHVSRSVVQRVVSGQGWTHIERK